MSIQAPLGTDRLQRTKDVLGITTLETAAAAAQTTANQALTENDAQDVLINENISNSALNTADRLSRLEKVIFGGQGYIGGEKAVFAITDPDPELRSPFYITESGKTVAFFAQIANLLIQESAAENVVLTDSDGSTLFDLFSSQFGRLKMKPSPKHIAFNVVDDWDRELLRIDKDLNLHIPGKVYAKGIVANVEQNALTQESDGIYRINGIRVLPQRKLIGWGDSITYGAGASATANRWINKLATALDVPLTNMGVSGTRSSSIASYSGALNTYMKFLGNGGSIAANTIPSTSDPVDVETDTDLLVGSQTSSLIITVAGVVGTLSRVWLGSGNPGNSYTFTRSTAGSAVTTDSNKGELVTFDTSDYSEYISVFFMGENDNADTEEKQQRLYDRYVSCVNHLSTLTKKYLILSPYLGTSQTISGSHYKLTIWARLKEMFGEHFVDLLYPMANGGDSTDASYLADTIHPNDTGHNVIYQECLKQAQVLSWI